ncbi:MAG: translocation/assembly module TamB domain-containing protein [Saprospiraceae bacterium]|nr:translocation/assembly module TamB domain-containing protein [Saprospiraceae bacterium]
MLNWSKSRILTLLKEEIDNRIEYSSLEFNFFKGAEIKNLILYDHHSDTLFYSDYVQISFAKNLASLFKRELSFNTLKIQNSQFNIVHYLSEENNSFDIFISQFKKSSTSSNNKLNFNLKEFDFNDLTFLYEDQNTDNQHWIRTENGKIEVNQMDLLAGFIDIDQINITNPHLKVLRNETKSNTSQSLKSIVKIDSFCKDYFAISCRKLMVHHGSFQYSNNKSLSSDSLSTDFFNANNFLLNEINFSLDNFNLNESRFYIQKIASSLKVNDFFGINTIRFEGIRLSHNDFSVNQFKIFSDESRIGDSLSIYLGNKKENFQDLDEAYFRFKLRDSRVKFDDLLYFIPSLRKNNFLNSNRESHIELAGNVFGTLNNLNCLQLAMDIPHQMEFKGDVMVRDITKRGEELVNLKVNHLVSSSDFVQSIVPSLKKVQVFEKIGRFQFKGRFDGFIEDFVSNGTFYSNLGVLKSDIRLNIRPGTDEAQWSGELYLNNFEIGKLLDDSRLGNVTLSANINNGRSLHVATMSADLNADISNLQWNNYNYQNLKINARINRNLFDGEARVKDNNLDVVFLGKLSDLGGTPKLKFNANIQKIDLKALNLSKASYIFSGELESDLINLDIDKMIGFLKLTNGLAYDYKNNRVINFGDAIIRQFQDSQRVRTMLQSSMINAEFEGKYKIKNVYNQLLTFLNRQYPEIFNDFSLDYKMNQEPLILKADIDFDEIGRLSSFLGIKVNTKELKLALQINTLEKYLNGRLEAKECVFNKIGLNKIHGILNAGAEYIEGQLSSESVELNDRKILGVFKFIPEFRNSKMRFSIIAKDTGNIHEKYNLKIASETSGPNKRFFLENSPILVNGYQWQFDQEASVEIGKKYLKLDHFHFYDSVSDIKISDIDHKGINIDAKSFDVGLLNPILKSPSLVFGGRYDFLISLDDIYNLNNLNGMINIINLRINKYSYGRFKIDFDMKDKSLPWNIKIQNQFKETDIQLAGSINVPMGNTYQLPAFDFVISGMAQGFELHFLESFINNISNTSGQLSGPIKIYRENKKVYLDANVVSNNSSTRVNYLNTVYHFDKQKILFDKNRIIFNKNTILDSLNNLINVNGNISHDNLSTFVLDVNLDSKKALVLNTKKGNNIYYYGYGLMQFQCSFAGPTNRIEMDFTGKTEKGSHFVIPVRYDQESSDIKFVKFRSIEPINTATPSLTPVVIRGMNVRMDIEMTEDCETSIIFDEKNSDILKGTGIGNLQIASLRDNTFSVNGNYEISQGQYLFTMLNFVNKPFKLKKGGTILWTGDPINANINIEASYEGLNVSPSSLINEYLVSNPIVSTEANERTKVDLSMLMKGSLLKPDITFKLAFPNLSGTLKNYVDTKVRFLEQNPQQLNQQVASLIVFRTFIESNATGGNASQLIGNAGVSTGISTLSEFLTNQFSIFISNFIYEVFYSNLNVVSGIDFKVNYNPNRSILGVNASANSSEWAFNLKHSLWDDEWAVTIGANVGNNSIFNKNSYFNPESAIEWNTPVEGLKMRIYYRGVDGIDGIRHRVGSGINYRKEFNSLGEIKDVFKRKSSKNVN